MDGLTKTQVMLFERLNETTLVTRAGAGQIVTQLAPSVWTQNPSAIGDGLTLTFLCTHCDLNYELTIAQQKDLIVVDWRPKLRRVAKEERP